MAAYGDPSMISPPSSISNGPEPQLPPLPPPLRSTQVLQPLSVYPVSALSQEATYDYVFGGPLDSHALSSTLKLTSPPIRLRSDVYRSQSLDSQRSSGVDDGRSSSAQQQQHSQHHHHSLQHSQHSSSQHQYSHQPSCHSQSQSRASSLKRSSSRYINCNDGTASIGSRKSNRSDGEDEDSLRQLLIELQKQVSVMSMNLSAKLDDLQRGDRHLETTVALCEIRTQLQELTKSVESCQSEVSEVKRDMVQIKHELDTVQQVKEEIEELREYVDRLEEHTHRRKLRLLEQGLTFFLTYAIFAAVLGMLQFGYNTGVINAPEVNIENFMKDVYKDRYGEDISEEFIQQLYSVAVSIFAIGGMLGGFSGGWMANRFGRKGGLLMNNVLGITGACLMGFTKMSHSYEILFLGRFIIGVNCGLNTSLVPMYISEIAPLNLRGGLGTVNQLAVTVGLLLSQVLGIEQILGTNDGWPVLLGLAICPAILQLLLLPICPESPRYLLITKQWEEEARKALRRLRASNQVEEDIEEMRAEERAQQSESSISTIELICSPTLRAPLMIGIVMQLSQQFSGINAVFYYSTSLFMSSGLTEESAKFATIGIGAIMVVMTLVSIPLMDRTGRRTLHLYGLGGMFIFSIFITISFLIKEMIDWMSYLSVVSTLAFVVFFAVGPGSIPWMITAELFSQGPRPSAMAIAVLVNWMANFVVGIGFPSLKTALENYTFLPFSVFLAIFWIFTYKKVPETKNKTFEEILALFRHGNGRNLRESRLYGSMLNCVNNLEPQSMNSGIERAALMISEEKTQHDSLYRTGTLDGEMGPYPVGTATLDGEMGPYPVGDALFGTATLDGEMGPYPVGDKMFGATMDGEMGPYPVGDSTNLLGYAMSYGASDALTSLGGSGRNYGTTGPTTINTATSTTCSPMPNRRTAASGRGRRRDLGRAPAEGAPDGQEQSYQHQQHGQQHAGVASRDSFRRHSAHGRIVCSAASERCSGDATRNTQMRTATCAPHHHHQQYDPTADDDDEDDEIGQHPPQQRQHSRHCSAGSSSRNTTPGTTRKCSDSLSRSRTSLRSETASSAAGHSHHHHHHHHRRQASSTSSTSCLLVARQTRTDDDETPEEEAAGTTATCNTEDERHPESASTLYVENCHCSRGNLTTTTTTDDDEELQQYFINRSVSRRPSNVSSTSRVSHRSNRSTPRSGGGGGGGGGSGGSSRSRQQSKRATPLSGVSCCSHHSHHSTQPQTYRSRGGPDSPSFLQDSGSNATISNFNINPARFQCSYYTADESENSYCSISGENIRQIQAQTQIQTALEMRQKEHEWILKRPEQPAPPPPSRLQPLPLPPLPPPDGGSDYNDSQQDVNSINGSITSIIESTSSDQPGGSTTTSTTTSTTQRQLQHVGERGGTKNGSSSGSQMILTPSKITIENIGQLSEIAANDYDFDDIDVSIPEMFHSPSKIKWNFLAGLEENKSNKSRISSISSLVDAASSGRGRSGTESGGADVSETGSERRRDDSSDNDYSPNRIQHQPLPPLPTPPPQSSSSCKIEELLKKSSPSASSEFKTVSIWRAENDDEANAIIFHHESEIVENCCNNHFLDHSSYDICTVDNCDYLIKSSDTKSEGKGSIYSAKSEERLNNSVALSSSAAANKLELKQRNIFTSTLLSASATPANVYSIISPDLKRFEKQTNLNRNSVNLSQNLSSPSSSSSSSIFLGNYNQTYRNINQNNGEDKLLNTSSSRSRPAPTAPAPPPPVATTSRSTTSIGFNNAADAPAPDASPLEPAPPFSITAAASTATAAAASQFYNKSYHINLTAQNRLYFHAYSNAVREMEQCPHQSPSPTSIQSERSPQPCAQCQELYGSPFFYSSTNATNEDSTGTGGTFADIANTSSSASLTGSGTGAGHRRGGGARPGSVRWRRNVSHSLRINGLVRVVRTRARKCADYIRHKERLTQNRFHRRK